MGLIMFEVRQWLRRPLFYAVCLVISLFVFSQIGDDFLTDAFVFQEAPIREAEAAGGQLPFYGFKIDNSEESRMQNLARKIYLAAHGNPLHVPTLGGFINRQIQLSETEQHAAQSVFFELTGVAYDALDYYDEFPQILSYEDFMQRVNELNETVGGDYFVLDPLIDGDTVPKTYEEALADYHTMVQEDKYTRALARYYSDYVGIALGVFPAFLAAFLLARDKRSGAAEPIATRPMSGLRYVAVKYLGLAIPLCAFVLLVALVPTAGAVLMIWQGHPVDLFAYLAYSVIWLLPTVLAVMALSLFMGEVFGSGIAAIPAVFLWWIVSVPRFHGPYPIYLSIIRFNSTDAMNEVWSSQITANRICITAFAALLTLLTGFIYEHKRARGGRYV